MTLELFQPFGYAVIINDSDNFGQVYTTIESIAKVIDMSVAVVERFVTDELVNSTKTPLCEAEIQTEDGVKKMTVLTEYQILTVIRAYDPEMVDCLAMSGGVRQYFYELAGFDIKAVFTEAYIKPSQPVNIQCSLNH